MIPFSFWLWVYFYNVYRILKSNFSLTFIVTTPKNCIKVHLFISKTKILLRFSIIFTMKYIGISTGVFFIEIWLERKKHGQIKRLISRRRLIFLCTIQEVIPNICTKFWNPRCSSSCEKHTHKHTHTQARTVMKKTKNIYPYIHRISGV